MDIEREIIIVGGGIAGLQCARVLQQAGRQPLVLERAKGVGGRVATRRYEDQPIDFGPMFLHGHDRDFLQSVMDVEGAVMHAAWPLRVEGEGLPCQPSAFDAAERRAVIPDGLNAFPRHLASGLEVRLSTRVERLAREDGRFRLETSGGESFACRDLVLAMALEEIDGLLGTLEPGSGTESLRGLLGLFASVPSLTVLATYPLDRPAPPWDLLYPADSEALQLVAQDSSKRIQPHFLSLVMQARPRWSRERLEQPEEAWAQELLRETARHAGEWVLEPLWTSAHRWRYARVDRGNELARPLLTRLGTGPRLGLAGDVFAPGGGVQAAWLSGSALARRLLNEA